MLKAKENLNNISMEHQNIAKGPPWKWWNGGPPLLNVNYEHTLSKNKKPVYELVICTLALKQTQEAKNQIELVETNGVWDDYKKITNPYEYVFLSLNRRMSKSVSNRIPLSRSYYKMLEIWKGANIGEEMEILIKRDGGLYTAHAAEGPGGFIEAIHDAVSKVMYSQAMTLRSTTRNIPGWRKTSAFLASHPEINITYGATDTGDLLLLENIDFFVEMYGKKKAHIYTADGGFDFSSDFNAQEETILPLLIAEFYLGLKSICHGGTIIIKIFDTTLRPTLEILWIVTRLFREWSIVKPRTSRGGNAERYIICKGFLGMDDKTDNFLRYSINLANNNIIQSFLNTPLEPEWIQTMIILQEAIAYQEKDIIERTLELIKNPVQSDIRSYIEQNVERSIQWCIEHNEEINSKWNDTEWRKKTINEEICELMNGYEHKKITTPKLWRNHSVAEVLQTHSQEPHRQQQKHRVALFSRSRHFRVEKSSSRLTCTDTEAEEGWQRV
jgi:hypothetical protein